MGMPHTIPFTVLLISIILSIKVTNDTSNYKRFSQAFNDRFCKIRKNVFRLVEIIIITSPRIAQYMSAFLNTFLTAVAVSFTGCVSRGPESLKIPHLLMFFHQFGFNPLYKIYSLECISEPACFSLKYIKYCISCITVYTYTIKKRRNGFPFRRNYL